MNSPNLKKLKNLSSQIVYHISRTQKISDVVPPSLKNFLLVLLPHGKNGWCALVELCKNMDCQRSTNFIKSRSSNDP